MAAGEGRGALRAVVPFLVGAGLYVIALEAASGAFLHTWFAQVGPGARPAWYFMGRDLVDAAWALAGVILLCAYTASALALRQGAVVWAAFGVNLVSFLGRIGRGLNVLLHTSNPWDQQRAASQWLDFDSYMASNEIADHVSLALAILAAAVGVGMYVRALRQEAKGS